MGVHRQGQYRPQKLELATELPPQDGQLVSTAPGMRAENGLVYCPQQCPRNHPTLDRGFSGSLGTQQRTLSLGRKLQGPLTQEPDPQKKQAWAGALWP